MALKVFDNSPYFKLFIVFNLFDFKMKHTLSGWSDEAKAVIDNAMKLACKYGTPKIGVEHLFISIINMGILHIGKMSMLCVQALEYFGINSENILDEIRAVALINENYPSPLNENTALPLTRQAEHVITLAGLNIYLLPNSAFIEPIHIFLSILQDETNIPSRILHNLGMSHKSFLKYFSNKNSNSELSSKIAKATEFYGKARLTFGVNRHGNPKNNKLSEVNQSHSDTPMLDNFSKDLTLLARRGELDPVIGRDKEIARVIQILSRRKKNNPIIIGEPGVGKTVIVEGLAIKIIERSVPMILENKRIISLDINSLVAGTQYRGQFEERIKGIMLEIEHNSDIILFIDEIHSIVGAGGVQGTLDLSEIIKPKLARGEFQCIGSTTLAEYRTKIEKDGALKRRFQKVMIYPPNIAETINILRNVKSRYEDFHKVLYTDAAIEACVNLSERYISDRFLPDKAIDIMDEAGAKCQIHIKYPKELLDIREKINGLLQQRNKALENKNYSKAQNLKKQIQDLEVTAKDLKNQWFKERKLHNPTIDQADISTILSQMTGIPLDKIDQNEYHNLQNMSAVLKQSVIGQPRAIDTLCRALQSSKMGLKDPDRPIGSFLFLGSTGVGKTELAKSLAKNLFHREDALIRVDMSEHMERFSVTRLIGAPPGFVGYEEGGSLSEKVRHNPYSVVLFDEIEKAHPDIYNLLLQILDEGRLTDSFGRSINFRNTVIIMTSNVGIRQFQDFGPGVGFKTTHREADEHKFFEQHIKQALKKKFAPEFLNRIDEIIVFNYLTIADLHTILNIHLNKFNQRLAKNHIHINLSTKAQDFICKKSYNPQYGARPLRRAIQKEIEDSLVDFLLENSFIPTESQPLNLIVDVEKAVDNLKISILQPEPKLV